MYTNQKLRVKWGNSTSLSFSASNGVKHGGVLSPILFAVYIDGLFQRLKKGGCGCTISNYFIGCLLFADDVTLLCPTIKGLRKMISICEQYALEFNVQFNGKKSKLLIFKGRGCNVTIKSVMVNGDIIHDSDSANHLGHAVSVRDKEFMTSAAISHFWKSFNLFMSDFGNVYSFIKCKLFKQFCCSFYGSSLWLLTSKRCNNVCIAWRKALRKVWNVPYRTHNRVLAILSRCLPLEYGLDKRFVKFANTILNHETSVIKSVASHALCNPQSIFNRNYRYVCHKYGADVQSNYVIKKWYQNITDIERADVTAVNDVIDVRDGYKHCNLTTDEILVTIEMICTN